MITAPIVYCGDHELLVAAFKARQLDAAAHAYWSDPLLESLRSRVKEFYIGAQRGRCCYCNRHLGSTNHRLWDVEHIVARKSHPHFMFEPLNLAASCPDCNIQKGEQNVLLNAERKTYPKDSAAFLIIHPHFDRFEEHIFCNDFVYIGKTKKGKKTIYVCDLLRFAQKFIDWENSASDDSFEAEVESLFDDNPGMSESAVQAIVSKLPQK
jgi:5-methylcytosine-specific restriction endonuclease McrA